MVHIRQPRLLIFFLLLTGIFALNHIFGLSRLFSQPENIPLLQASVSENLFLAILIYIAVTVVGCVALALPGLIFAMAAGLLFGPVYGTIACSLATTIGAALAFLLGRYFLRDALKPWVIKNRRIRALLFEESGKSDIFLLLITRLLPVFPYNLQNFAYGITNIGFWPYTVYSFLFMLPGTAVYTIAAAGFADAEKRITYLCISSLLLIISVSAGWILHKRRSLFRNYPASCGSSLLFIGCNFPALFPRATRKLMDLCRDQGVSIAFDCCGKPLEMKGRDDEAKRIIGQIEAQLDALGVQELITVCPNCYYYLKPLLSTSVVSIYEKLAQWNYHSVASPPLGWLFSPCPDRKEGRLKQQIADLLPIDGLQNSTAGCCNRGYHKKSPPNGPLFSYCANCAGQWQRRGVKPMRHLLPYLLGIDEPPDTAHGLLNRWRFKYTKN